MHDNDTMTSSIEQDQYVEFAKVIREDLARRVSVIDKLNVVEVHTLIHCVKDSLTLELSAKSYDAKASL